MIRRRWLIPSLALCRISLELEYEEPHGRVVRSGRKAIFRAYDGEVVEQTVVFSQSPSVVGGPLNTRRYRR